MCKVRSSKRQWTIKFSTSHALEIQELTHSSLRVPYAHKMLSKTLLMPDITVA